MLDEIFKKKGMTRETMSKRIPSAAANMKFSCMTRNFAEAAFHKKLF